MRLSLATGAALVGALIALSACDRGGDTAPARDHGGSYNSASPAHGDTGRSADRGGYADGASTPTARAPVEQVDGKPIWAENRRHTAQENLDYQFQKWGQSVGAKDEAAYARKAHAFIDHPPSAAETVSRRNGDQLIYDAGSNTFAVARKDGAPRAFRKPDDGPNFWVKAKEDAASGGRSRRYARTGAGGARSGGAED